MIPHRRCAPRRRQLPFACVRRAFAAALCPPSKGGVRVPASDHVALRVITTWCPLLVASPDPTLHKFQLRPREAELPPVLGRGQVRPHQLGGPSGEVSDLQSLFAFHCL